MRRDYAGWLPVILVMGLIFILSTDLASSEHTSRVIGPLLRWLKPDVSEATIDFAHLLVRKLGHLSEYGVLALLLHRAVSRSIRLAEDEWSWVAASSAWLMAAAFAASDELHQSLYHSRTASAGDVMIDSSGALVALTALYLWQRTRPGPAARRAA